jgi:signal transduction histidine kinase
MKKVALVFVLAVLAPSLVLAWLAVRSLRDQQFICERQQSLIYQGVADSLAKEVEQFLTDRQHEFGSQVESLLAGRKPLELAPFFAEEIKTNWPLAEVGFVVTLNGSLLSPSAATCAAYPEARLFTVNNNTFLANRESAQVYWNPKALFNTVPAQAQQSQYLNASPDTVSVSARKDAENALVKDSGVQRATPAQVPANAAPQAKDPYWSKSSSSLKGQARSVMPERYFQAITAGEENLSKLAPAETEFRQLIGELNEGTLARFVDNKLSVLLWHRCPGDQNLIFGAQLSLRQLVAGLTVLMQQFDPSLREDVCIAVLDDKARPASVSLDGFRANWKRPFVATEIGEELPHWEAAVYLRDPDSVTRSATAAKWTIGLLVCVLVIAIGVGSWLIVTDMNRQLALARQKTDFVSNVSHELKTPLTSIRMFAELLAEGRVSDAARQRSYLVIITAETARLTRLINTVLDFARIERGEMKYHFQKCDLSEVVREIAGTCRPHLESQGFRFEYRAPEEQIWVNGDRDALAQVLMNLLSNAEKYSDSRKEIVLEFRTEPKPLPHAEVKVMDRGLGVPKGCEEKIFEKFYRAHDSLSSGIQGSGLGLTLARQIARAHGGEITYEPREGGGSCFSLRLPLIHDSLS